MKPIANTIICINIDWNKNLKEVPVLIEKLCLGKIDFISFKLGISEALTSRALPLRPENRILFKYWFVNVTLINFYLATNNLLILWQFHKYIWSNIF